MCNMFRPLTADEVECRVAQVGKKQNGGVYASFLIYKDARVDQKLLDEVVGPKNWKNDYAFINGSLYCTISIWDSEKKEWISKQNVGTESNTEKEKGQASDAFKRAGFNWGIGRELYSAPKIFIDLKEGEYYEQNGTLRVKSPFTVTYMHCDNNMEIDRLTISDKRGNVRFFYQKDGSGSMQEEETPSLQKAIEMANNASSGEQVRKVWESFKSLYGSEEDFIQAIVNNPNNPNRK